MHLYMCVFVLHYFLSLTVDPSWKAPPPMPRTACCVTVSRVESGIKQQFLCRCCFFVHFIFMFWQRVQKISTTSSIKLSRRWIVICCTYMEQQQQQKQRLFKITLSFDTDAYLHTDCTWCCCTFTMCVCMCTHPFLHLFIQVMKPI